MSGEIVIWFLVVYDVCVSFVSFYSFYILILKPTMKYRHSKKNGIYTEFTLYDEGEYRGAITLNISEIVRMLFNEPKQKTKKV